MNERRCVLMTLHATMTTGMTYIYYLSHFNLSYDALAQLPTECARIGIRRTLFDHRQGCGRGRSRDGGSGYVCTASAFLQAKSPRIMPVRPPSGWKTHLFNNAVNDQAKRCFWDLSAVGFEWRSGRRNQNRSPSGWKIDLFNNLPRRHDYNVDVAGGATGATMRRTSRTLMAKMAPTTRRVFARDADGQKIDERSLPPTLPRSPTCERIERCRPQGVWRTC
jgi:hypothetical protein